MTTQLDNRSSRGLGTVLGCHDVIGQNHAARDTAPGLNFNAHAECSLQGTQCNESRLGALNRRRQGCRDRCWPQRARHEGPWLDEPAVNHQAPLPWITAALDFTDAVGETGVEDGQTVVLGRKAQEHVVHFQATAWIETTPVGEHLGLDQEGFTAAELAAVPRRERVDPGPGPMRHVRVDFLPATIDVAAQPGR